jgi:putative SOS response-associated peptidase YedK
MCYDAATMTRKAKAYAQRYGNEKIWEEAKQKSPPYYHLNGFDEPDLPVITNKSPDQIQFFQWGFVPFVYAPSIQGRPMNSLNARDDKIFTEKSIYRKSAESSRCLVMLDGFFDHHKKNGVAYPYYVRLKSGDPFLVGGLYQRHVHEVDEIEIDTVTLVTGPANKEMAWIHNEPAYSSESRMIFIVQQSHDDVWLNGTIKEAQEAIKPLPDGELSYHPCRPIKSNKKLNRVYLGNDPKIQEYQYYPELEESQGSLF